MKKTRFLKYLITCFSIAMLLICGIACRGTKGTIKQASENIQIHFYSTTQIGNEESKNSFGSLHHYGIEPRMYVYKYSNSMGEPVYVKLDDVQDGAGVSLREEFYEPLQETKWIYVDHTQTLIYDYKMYRYDDNNDLYHAYTIRVEWEIIIDYVDVPPDHEHTWEEKYRVEPTCDAQGYIVSVCSCGLEETDYISATGHDWGAWTSDGDGVYHSRVCKTDSSHVQRQKCGGAQATCIKKAGCLDCGEEFGLLGNHKYDKYHVCIYCGNDEIANESLLIETYEEKYPNAGKASVIHYYGEYESRALVAMMAGSEEGFIDALWTETVAGYDFNYSNGNRITVLYEGEFYTLTEAYDKGYLTKQDIENIARL